MNFSNIFMNIRLLISFAACCLGMANQAWGQSLTEHTLETAKPSDIVSPYGVSYTTGSFTYSVPLFAIGNGEWPNQMVVSLDYDSSGARYPNDPWTLSIQNRTGGIYESYPIGFEGNVDWANVRYGMNLVIGNRLKSFYLGNSFSNGSSNINPSQFASVSLDGNKIEFIDSQLGRFRITGRDGSLIEFNGGGNSWATPVGSPVILTLPNGHKVQYDQPSSYNGVTFPSANSTGLFIRGFGNQICVFNAAHIDPATVTSCSQSQMVATINWVTLSGGAYTGRFVSSVTNPSGDTYNFEYQTYTSSTHDPNGDFSSTVWRHHLSCVKEPGQSTCAVRNIYDPCDGAGVQFYNPEYHGSGSYGPIDPEWSGSRDRVARQELADGRVVTYSYEGPWLSYQSGCEKVWRADMTEAGAVTRVELALQNSDIARAPGASRVVDPLGRITKYTWSGENPAAQVMAQPYRLNSVELPDGRLESYEYDDRGNLLRTITTPRPWSGDPVIETRASFPAVCSNPKTCNQPTSLTDANGNVTTFTYDATHGGVLTKTGPAVGGVSPMTRYYYAQREAWLRSGAGYAKTGEPIWLKSEEYSCRTSTLDPVAGTCSVGAGDLVRTLYDYGPDTGPNNLWLRGVAVEADGQTLRTCYQYDELGRRIAETKPLGTGATCP